MEANLYLQKWARHNNAVELSDEWDKDEKTLQKQQQQQ